jgi:hypothetical protein
MRIFNEAFTKQLFHEGDRTVSGGMDSGFTSQAMLSSKEQVGIDNLNTTQTLEYTKDRYNAKIRNERVSSKVPPTTYIGRRMK